MDIRRIETQMRQYASDLYEEAHRLDLTGQGAAADTMQQIADAADDLAIVLHRYGQSLPASA